MLFLLDIRSVILSIKIKCYVNSCGRVGKLELVTAYNLLTHPTCIVPFCWRKNLGVRLIFF